MLNAHILHLTKQWLLGKCFIYTVVQFRSTYVHYNLHPSILLSWPHERWKRTGAISGITGKEPDDRLTTGWTHTHTKTPFPWSVKAPWWQHIFIWNHEPWSRLFSLVVQAGGGEESRLSGNKAQNFWIFKYHILRDGSCERNAFIILVSFQFVVNYSVWTTWHFSPSVFFFFLFFFPHHL